MIFQCFDWWCQKSSKATKKLDAVLTALPVFSSWQMKCLGQRSNGPTVSSDHKIFYHLVSKSSTWFTVNTSPSRLMFFLHLWLFLCHFGKTWGQQLLYSQGVPPQPCSSFIHLQKKKKSSCSWQTCSCVICLRGVFSILDRSLFPSSDLFRSVFFWRGYLSSWWKLFIIIWSVHRFVLDWKIWINGLPCSPQSPPNDCGDPLTFYLELPRGWWLWFRVKCF